VSFHSALASRGKGAKGWANTWTEVEHLGNRVFRASLNVGHQVFRDKSDGQWKKRKLTDNRPDHVVIQGSRCCVEVYPFYARYFDVDHEEVRVEEEQWVVQRLFKEPDTWRDVGAWNPVIAVEEGADAIKVSVTYETDYGPFILEYLQRDGSPLKHNITFTNNSGSTETFRVLQRWAGIDADRVNKEEVSVTRNKLEYHFRFEKSGVFRVDEIQQAPTLMDYAEADKKRFLRSGECNNCGVCCIGCLHCSDICEIYETRPEACRAFPWNPDQIKENPECGYSFEDTGIIEMPTILKATVIDIHLNGLKADFIYGDWLLALGESLEIDPATATLDNPTEDGYVEHFSNTSEANCLSSPIQRQNTQATINIGGATKYWFSFRGYVEWPISSLFGGTLTANPFFKYEGIAANTTDTEINPLTEQAPSAASNDNLYAYIATGTAYVDPWNLVVAQNQSQDLGAAARTDLQDAIDAAQSWFAIGLQSPADECQTGPVNGEIASEEDVGPAVPPPTLYVEYTPPPTVGFQPGHLKMTLGLGRMGYDLKTRGGRARRRIG